MTVVTAPQQPYSFKNIVNVPDAKAFVDIVLSRTQRTTPTEIHRNFKISRIRTFYMRKINFCRQTIVETLDRIVKQFPRLSDIHPFYADLCNILYDRDHYKAALGHCNAIKRLVETIGKEYVRLTKYSDSLFKSKMLKKAALGRMCTAIKKLHEPLEYLEFVRQSLSRLPCINPHAKTLILTGYPSVGKSSFMNHVTRANVEVQPFPFTTRALYVGHFDLNLARWQVIDTPGLLDRSLDERNTLEMTAITALAHIQATVLFLLDISEECGATVSQQVDLYKSLLPLFRNRPFVLVLNKIDVCSVDSLSEETKTAIEKMSNEEDICVRVCQTSTLNGQGVETTKEKACQDLLDYLATKKSSLNTSLETPWVVANQHPTRPAYIPESVIRSCQMKKAKSSTAQGEESMTDDTVEPQTEKELEEEFGGPGVYSQDLKKNHLLENNDWRYDSPPELFNGYNVVDFVDPNIEALLMQLEEEEKVLKLTQTQGPSDRWKQVRKTLAKMHMSQSFLKLKNKLRTSANRRIIPRHKLAKPRVALNDGDHQLEMNPPVRRKRHTLTQPLTTRNLALEAPKETIAVTSAEIQSATVEERKLILKTSMDRLNSISSSANSRKLMLSMPRKEDRVRALNLVKKAQKSRGKKGMKGEGDRTVPDWKPKHLFSGKRKLGKPQRR